MSGLTNLTPTEFWAIPFVDEPTRYCFDQFVNQGSTRSFSAISLESIRNMDARQRKTLKPVVDNFYDFLNRRDALVAYLGDRERLFCIPEVNVGAFGPILFEKAFEEIPEATDLRTLLSPEYLGSLINRECAAVQAKAQSGSRVHVLHKEAIKIGRRLDRFIAFVPLAKELKSAGLDSLLPKISVYLKRGRKKRCKTAKYLLRVIAELKKIGRADAIPEQISALVGTLNKYGYACRGDAERLAKRIRESGEVPTTTSETSTTSEESTTSSSDDEALTLSALPDSCSDPKAKDDSSSSSSSGSSRSRWTDSSSSGSRCSSDEEENAALGSSDSSSESSSCSDPKAKDDSSDSSDASLPEGSFLVTQFLAATLESLKNNMRPNSSLDGR